MRKTLNILEKKKIINKIRGILLKRKEIEFSILFGSFLQELPFKDIDVGIFLNKDYLEKINKIDYIIELGIYIEDRIKGFNFDIVILNELNSSFLYHVFKEGKLLFARDKEKYYNYIIYIIEDYLDYKKYRDLLIKELKNTI
jgi:predicted nucleotidyltransferase